MIGRGIVREYNPMRYVLKVSGKEIENIYNIVEYEDHIESEHLCDCTGPGGGDLISISARYYKKEECEILRREFIC